MKTDIRTYLSVVLIFSFILSYAQTTIPFAKRYETSGINGDLTIIGNSILGETATDPYNGNTQNNFINMVYIDVDNDLSTFSSSSAEFTTRRCNRVVYAGLYWGAIRTPVGSEPDKIKFKVPGGSYQDIVADVSIDRIYYKDVTAIVAGNSNPSGNYFVANVSSEEQRNRSAGWSLVLVYEDSNESRKYISTFDGFSAVRNDPFDEVEFSYSGFVTPPAGPVEGRVGVGALEGDLGWSGDQMLFKSDANATFTALYDAENDVNNFFNSKITKDGAHVTNRNVNSTNTLGWDQKLLNLSNLNPGNSLIGNNETGATVRVSNNVGGDHIFTFLNTFAVNVIEPTLKVLTSVEDTSGNQITHSSPVPLGATVWYNINFQNIGTDNAENTYILNVLPFNVALDTTSLVLPAGVTSTYNPTNRELRFDIDPSLVEKGSISVSHDIRYQVTASDQCFDFTDACTNLLENSILSYYDGESSGQNITGQPGFNGLNSCGLGNIGSMDLFVDTSSCSLDSELFMCNNTLTFEGDDGYDTYIWTNENGDVVGNTKEVTVNGAGIYSVLQRRTGCTETTRIVTVYGLDVTVESIPALCKDSNGSVNITVNEASTAYTYELYRGANLLTAVNFKTSNTHTFSNLAIGNYSVKSIKADGCFDISDFTITEPTLLVASSSLLQDVAICNSGIVDGSVQVSGSGGIPPYEYSIDGGTTYQVEDIFYVNSASNYRIIVKDANGCTTPTTIGVGFDTEIQYDISKEDIVCVGDTTGTISVNLTNNDFGYAITYSLDGTNYQVSPNFSGLGRGTYELWVKKEKGTVVCETLNTVVIDQLIELQLSAVSDFSCDNGFNLIIAQVDPKYKDVVTYYLDGVDTNNRTGIFDFVSGGSHKVTVKHNVHNCSDEPIILDVNEYKALTASTDKIQNVTTCNGAIQDGSVKTNVTGGLLPYEYSIDGGRTYQSEDIFYVSTENTYEVLVKDAKGCLIPTTVNVGFDEEIVYEVTKEDIICVGETDGRVSVNMTNDQGYNITYSIDGNTYQNSPNFTGLSKGTYELLVRKEKGPVVCETSQTLDIDQLIELKLTAASDFECDKGGNMIIAQVDPIYLNDVTYYLDGKNTNNTSGIFENVNKGSHEVTVKHNEYSCTDEPVIVAVEAYAPLVFNVMNTNLNEYTVDAKGGKPNYEYSFESDDDYHSENVLNIVRSKDYSFYVRDEKGCVTEQTMYLEVLDIEIPDFFTPEGDGINDTWYPINIVQYPNIDVKIFDRYQRIIANYQGVQYSWDGTYDSKKLPSGDYWYVIKLNSASDNREFKGNFTLVR